MYKGTKQFWPAFRFLICVIMIFGFVYQPVTFINASTPTLKEINTTYPNLFVTKKIENAELIINKSFEAKVVLGETFVISITIHNFGNKTAYNVTFIDSPSNPWVFEYEGLTKISYLEIAPNETRQFSYLVTAKSLGKFKLDAAQVDYYTSEINPAKFIAFSNSLTISVFKPPEDFSLTNMNSALTLFIVLTIGNLILIFRLISPKFNRRPNE
ncbi:MAG: BatD family protein [Candidatus Hodarchaeota archaeon]